MEERFTIFIDESGEAGIERIRSSLGGGASPYMTLGAMLIRNSMREHIAHTLDTISNDLKKDTLHCSRLNHYQLLYFCRQIVKCEMRLFGVISNKQTLEEYKTKIEANSSKYYNKCCQYLLERVG